MFNKLKTRVYFGSGFNIISKSNIKRFLSYGPPDIRNSICYS